MRSTKLFVVLLTLISVAAFCACSTKYTNENYIVNENDDIKTPGMPFVNEASERTADPYDDIWREQVIGTDGIICEIDAPINRVETEKYWVHYVHDSSFTVDDVIAAMSIFDEELPDGIDFSNVISRNRVQIQSGSQYEIILADNLLSIQKGQEGVFQLEEWIRIGNAYPGEPEGTELKQVKISLQDALIVAATVQEQMQAENLALSASSKARILSPKNETISEGWYLTFSRNDGYIPFNMASYCSLVPSSNNASVVPGAGLPEVISMYVDEHGIQYFSWRNRLVNSTMQNKMVALLPFEEIVSKAKSVIIETFDTQSFDDAHLPRLYEIDLTSCVSTDPTGEKCIIPIWVFLLTNKRFEEHALRPFIICVNAIDGTLIDPLPIIIEDSLG